MIEWLTVLFDSRVFLQANAILWFVLLGFFYILLFFKGVNAAAYFFSWGMDNIVRLANLIQTVYTLFLLSADIALLVLRKIR